MAGRPSTLRINVTSDSQQARADLDDFAGETESTMAKIGRVGAAGAAAAGALIGAALVTGITGALERESIGARTAAALGQGGDAAKRYGKLAGGLWAEGVTEDVAAGADAIRRIMADGLLPTGATDTQITRMATRVSDLATVFEEDLGAATRAVSQLMRTGLARDADHALDIITKGLQSSANRSEDLLDTLNDYSTQFRDMGISGEQAIGLIQQGLEAGARDADIVADAFKELNIRVKDKSAAEALEKLGLNADEMARKFREGGPQANAALDQLMDKLREVKNPADQTALAVALIGTQAEDMGEALFALDPSKAVTKLGEVNGAADQLGTTLRDTTSASLSTVIRQIQTGLVDAAEAALPYIEKIAQFLRENVTPAARAANEVLQETIDVLLKLKGPSEDAVNAWRSAGDALGKLNENLGPLSPLMKFLLLVVGYSFLITIQAVGQALEFIFNTIRFLISPVDTLYDKLTAGGWADFYGWLKKIGDLFEKIADLFKNFPKLPSFGDIIPGLSSLSLASASATPAGGLAAFAAAPAAEPPVTLLRPTNNITVMLDGMPLRAIVRTEVRAAQQAEGARFLAGGWA